VLIPYTLFSSGADSVQDANGSDHGGVRERVVGPRPAVRPGAEHGDALAGLLAQARRPGAHTAQHLHQSVPRSQGEYCCLFLGLFLICLFHNYKGFIPIAILKLKILYSI
jgi:hypothetical protein